MTRAPEAPAEGPRLRLRRPRPEERDLLFDWYNDPEVVAPFDRFELSTREEFEADLDAALRDPRALGPRYVIERRSDAAPLGMVGHYRAHPVLTLTDIWYVLAATEARRKGYGTEAVELLVDHLFRSEDLPRIGASTDVDNTGSFRLLERLGFRREGELREALFHHGRYHTVYLYGVTRSEWELRDRGPTRMSPGSPPSDP